MHNAFKSLANKIKKTSETENILLGTSLASEYKGKQAKQENNEIVVETCNSEQKLTLTASLQQ